MEYFEDLWESNPTRAMELVGVEEDRAIVTGDEEIDEIERRLQAGEDADEIFKDWGEGVGTEEEAPEEFDDDYTEEPEQVAPKPLSWSDHGAPEQQRK